MTATSTTTNPLPPIRRFIATHTPTGTAIFDQTTLPSTGANPKPIIPIFASTSTPASNSPSTLTPSLNATSAGIFNHPNGTSFRAFDMAPGAVHGMHRTVSLDYAFVACGEVELEVDNGVKEVMRAGDAVVIRGTNRKWVNNGSEWVRIVAVVVDAEKVVTDGGKVLDWEVSRITVPVKITGDQ